MPGPKKIVFIGSGNVATYLAKSFYKLGNEIIQVYSRDLDHAKTLADAVGCFAINNLGELNREADLYIIAVKDDAIEGINKSLRLPGKVVAHTSGAVGLDAIASISDKRGVFYPLQTFTKGRELDLSNTPFIIEGTDSETVLQLEEFGRSISKTVVELPSAERLKLHIAAVFTNNFVNHILGEAKSVLEGNIAFELLEPLAKETVAKAFSIGPDLSQTGPARRNDIKTIESHIHLLEALPETKEIYRLLTEAIVRKYKEGVATA